MFPVTIKPLVIGCSIAMTLALTACGVGDKPTIQTTDTSSSSGNGGNTKKDLQVRVYYAQNTNSVFETDKTAAFKFVYVNQRNGGDTDGKYLAPEDITVHYELSCSTTEQNPAIADTDFTGATSGSIVIPKGKNRVDLEVPLKHNPAPTDDKKLCVKITQVSDANLFQVDHSKAEYTIKNTDIGVRVQNATTTKETDAGQIEFTVQASEILTADKDVYFQLIDGTAQKGTHYHMPTSNKVTIPQGKKEAKIVIPLLAGAIHQDLKFQIKIISQANALAPVIHNDIATGTLEAPKPPEAPKRSKVNPTGIKISATNTADDGNCNDTRQDCHHSANQNFNFTKLDSKGNPLSANATEWSCVKDETTGLIWETKTFTPKIAGKYGAEANINKDFRDIEISEYTYRDSFTGLGFNDTGANSGKDDCQDKDKICTTAHYVKKVNAMQLCGLTNWRLPTRHELFNIINLEPSQPENRLPTNFLVNNTTTEKYRMPFSGFWTQSLGRDIGNSALDKVLIMLSDGTVNTENPESSYSTGNVLLISNGK